ncbi:MAG: GNAT family N-acetyltransferase [Thermoplasmata archaeon]
MPPVSSTWASGPPVGTDGPLKRLRPAGRDIEPLGKLEKGAGTMHAPSKHLTESFLADCHANLIEASRIVARARPEGRVEEEWGVVRVASGIPRAGSNTVFVTEIPDDPVDLIARSKRFMQAAGVSHWRVVAPESVAPALSSVPEEAGLIVRNKVPGLVLVPIPPRVPSTPPELRIRPATNPALWEQMLRTGFESLLGAAPENPAKMFSFELSKMTRGYLGYVGGLPAATSWEVPYRGVCGIHLVGTLPPFRRRGFGTAMTWRATVDSRKDGCRAAFLQASDMGLSAYTRMGFRKALDYIDWRAA